MDYHIQGNGEILINYKMETIETLDVTVIEPKFKHPTIFQKFDEIDL